MTDRSMSSDGRIWTRYARTATRGLPRFTIKPKARAGFSFPAMPFTSAPTAERCWEWGKARWHKPPHPHRRKILDTHLPPILAPAKVDSHDWVILFLFAGVPSRSVTEGVAEISGHPDWSLQFMGVHIVSCCSGPVAFGAWAINPGSHTGANSASWTTQNADNHCFFQHLCVSLFSSPQPPLARTTHSRARPLLIYLIDPR